MKFSAIPYADAALVFALLLAPLPAAAMFDCERVVSDGQRFNLKALGGPHSVVTSVTEGSRIFNTTYTVDICSRLRKKGKSEQCPNGSRVCAIRRLIESGEDKHDEIDLVTPLAGELANHGGSALDHKVTRLSKLDPSSERKGLRVVFKGGFGYTETHIKRKKHTVIDFVCNKDLDGTEGEYEDTEDKYEAMHDRRADDDDKKDDDKKDDDKKGDENGDDEDGDKDKDKDKDKDEDATPKEVQLGLDKNPSLVFERYGPDDSDTDVDVLLLTWSSKHVCESKAGDGDDGEGGNGDEDGEGKKPSARWGAFTWIVILVFLGTAAYLIFGSWLNYTRYGARGWDLLPHGDTIRDIPYLLKDWARRVLNTVQGSGSRGGYSAV
ncbi:autophagy-related protein 27 [Nemania sp. NC0429]|nr:autophagy-related protein 27 [Nemania sp. NC0429]